MPPKESRAAKISKSINHFFVLLIALWLPLMFAAFFSDNPDPSVNQAHQNVFLAIAGYPLFALVGSFASKIARNKNKPTLALVISLLPLLDFVLFFFAYQSYMTAFSVYRASIGA